VRAALRGTGELLMTTGVVVLLFAVYSLYGTGLQTARAQSELREDLQQSWAMQPQSPSGRTAARAPVPPPVLGEGVAVLRVPRLGPDYQPVVVEGVGREELKRGPGHYPGSAMPGEVGNFVLAGHRTTYGAPFGRYGELELGDPVTVERRGEVFTYRIVSREIVAPDDVAVMLPVPRQAEAAPTQALLTLITCHPQYSARQRLILTAALESTQPAAEARAAA
jgi:sortase A